MRRSSSFDGMRCNIAHALQAIGDEWSFLIIRDAMKGMSRYDEFLESLGISPTVLSRRLSSLVDAGILEKMRYSDRPQRFEYVLTDAGRDLELVIASLDYWGHEHLSSDDPKLPTPPTVHAERAIRRWFDRSAATSSD